MSHQVPSALSRAQSGRGILAGVVLAFLLSGLPAGAAWQAGVAKADITPQEPIWLAGYSARTQPSAGVRQHIFVKALALKDDQGPVTVMVSSDLLGFPREVADPIAARVAAAIRPAARAAALELLPHPQRPGDRPHAASRVPVW